MRTANRRWTIAGLATLALLAAIPITAITTRDSAQAAAAVAGDGTTSVTAGASCWGIKTQIPTSQDGTYWVLTASMDRPIQVACDMTTDGGGWALVGRGRNGWTFNPAGQGSPASIASTPDGTGAFGPAALSTDAITGLLDGAPVTSLADGIRLERATSSTGASRQDYRLFERSRRWTWSLPAGELLDKVSVNGTNYAGSNTKDTAATAVGQTTNALAGIQDTRRLSTNPTAAQGYQNGFALGTQVTGGSSATSNFLWTTGTATGPLAFTKVWIRPRIANGSTGFSPVPAAGFAAQAMPSGLQNRSELAPWGVEGYNHDNEATSDPWNANVLVVKVYGDRVYVGGRFRTVKQGPGGAEYSQGSLAAFDLDGNWISTFRPQVPGRVWDMTMTADGKLIIGGDFTSVDGRPDTSGLAALDPATGAVITSWKGSVTRSSGNVIVRSLDTRGDWIYAGGRFNSFTGGTSAPITITNTVSMRTSNGNPGPWHPQVYASPIAMRVSADGTRVYLGGYFNSVNGDTGHGYYGITNIADGTVVGGLGPFQPSIGSGTKQYQQAVGENGANLLVGGSEHDFQMYDRNRQTLLDSSITKNGGDTQAIENLDGNIYVTCHCANWIYQGTNNWSNPAGYRAVDPIRFIGRFDARSMEYDTSWLPDGLKGIKDDGIWSVAMDGRKCLWVGGDLVRGAYSGNAARDYLGGFARFCPTDGTPPTTPSSFTATAAAGSVRLAWGASTDAGGPVSYDVYRDDRVIATVSGTSYTDTTADGAHRYTVRAADARGNRSASPAPIAVNGPPPQLATPIPFGSTWSYADDGADLGTAWRDGSGSWPSGPAPLGWGGTYATAVGPTHPTTTYFRRTFDVADPSQVKVLDIGARFTQGAVVYVNGVEVGRTNLPTGAIGSTTVANQYVGGATDLETKRYAVPGSLLKVGTNTIAVEVHGWRANSGKVFLDLEATTSGATADTTPPSAPVLTATAGTGTVDLSWRASTDDTALAGYLIARDNAPLAVTGPTATSFTDAPVDTAGAHTYTVTAFDQSGNTRTSSPVSTSVAADPAVLAARSTWNWWYQATAPSPGWQNPTFSLAGWQQGAGELGFGDGQATVISTAPTPRPLTAYFRTDVTVADPARFASYALDLVANAGGVVYANGIEVGRVNMPAGPVGPDTYAVSTPPAAQRHVPVRIMVPASAFRAGSNTIAVEVHLNYRSAPTMGFDLAVTGLR